MNHTTHEMTLAEIFGDPLILSVMRADGVALNEFKELMYTAAKALRTRDGTSLVAKLQAPGHAASAKRALVATMQPLFTRSFGPCSAHI